MVEHDRIEDFENSNPNNFFKIKEYYKNNELVMKNRIDSEGERTELFKNGLLHDGDNNQPAVVIFDSFNGFEFKHYKEGKLHNEKGPAINLPKFPDLNKWYLDGKELSKVEIAVLKMKNFRDNLFNKNNTKENESSNKIKP